MAFAKAGAPRLAEPLRRPGHRAALATETFSAREYLVRAKADTIRLTATQLAIGAQRRVWEKRMGQLLLGAPRRGPSSDPCRGTRRGRRSAGRST